MGVSDAATSFHKRQEHAQDKEWTWPPTLLPFCYWGCEVYECVDCSNPKGSMIHFDVALGGPSVDNFDVTALSLEQWVEKWLNDESAS